MTHAARSPSLDECALGELIDSLPLLGDAKGLRERAVGDGFLFFRGLLPRTDVMALRKDLLTVVERHGWRQPGQDDLGGALDLEAINRVPEGEMRMDIGVSALAYDDVQRLEALHAFPHHPRLMDLYRGIFGEKVLLHPRHIVRMVTGHRSMSPTPPHQDFPLIQGTANTWTCWIPVGDCPREMGGLAVLRRSHRNGCLPIQAAAGAGGMAVQLCPGEADWVSTDYAAGDVLTFPSHTVHRALRSRRPGDIRLSLDVRYQPASESIEEKSLLPHCGLTWEDIYKGWKSDAHKYYWRGFEPRLSPWDSSLHQPGRRIC